MKYLLLSVLIASGFIVSPNAQAYHPFDTSDVVWNELKESSLADVYPPSKFIETYIIGADTIIDELGFHKIYLQESMDSLFIGCFREKDKKIYYAGVDYFEIETDSVVLLYDFNKQKEDTILTGAGNLVVIEDIDSIWVGDLYRKRFHMYDGQDWIEGIGSTFGFLYPITNIPTMYWRSELICYNHRNSLLYLSPNYIDCTTEKVSPDWAPVGATWYYSEKFAFSGDINYMKFESIDDTIIQDKHCITIVKERQLLCNARPSREYMYSKNDTVFFYDSIFNEFQILYDFNAKKGDSWLIKVREDGFDTDSIIVSIDSVGSIEVNNHSLKALYVTYKIVSGEYFIDYQSTIVERIGDILYMFNFSSISAGACDMNWTDGLRCYDDSVIGYYETGIADSCTYTYKWTAIDERQNWLKWLIIYPNPTDDNVTFKVDDVQVNRLYKILDIYGRELISGKLEENNQVSLQKYQSGVYILRINQSQGNRILNYKIIKR